MAAARRTYSRVAPEDLLEKVREGALLVDIRPSEQRTRDGPLPTAVVIDRNVLEWRLDPTCPFRINEPLDDRLVIIVCNEGYSSSLAVASLRALGLERATDLIDGFQGLLDGCHLAGLGEASVIAGR